MSELISQMLAALNNPEQLKAVHDKLCKQYDNQEEIKGNHDQREDKQILQALRKEFD